MRHYFEIGVVAVILSVLSLFITTGIDLSRWQVEEAMVQSEAATLRLGLMDQAAHHLKTGVALPASNNPFVWLNRYPENYLGERRGIVDERSVWYFDSQAEELNYRFHDGHRARFQLSRDGRSGVMAGVGLQRLADREN